MRKITFLVLYGMLWCVSSTCAQEAEISGRIQLHAPWLKKVYISSIPDFNQMFAVSYKSIVASGDIDTNGNFTVRLPAAAQESLYRLHFIRQGDPVSTLIIGGREENHVFFLARATQHIWYHSDTLIRQADISGGNANEELKKLLATVNNDTLNRETIKNSLINGACTFSSETAGLMAIHYMFGLNNRQKDSVSRCVVRFSKNNPYGSRIFQQYRTSYNWIPFVCITAALFMAFLLGSRAYRKRKQTLLHRVLSPREMNIVSLIINGKSNKEIAMELSIEISTVKTHVNNIYSKLKINSRKQLYRYKDMLAGKQVVASDDQEEKK